MRSATAPTLAATGPVAPADGPPPAPRPALATLLAWGLLLAVLAGSWQGAEMRPWVLVRDSGNIVEYARSFFPPDFHEWRHYVAEMLVTVQIAVWGTALAVIGAIPLGLLAASNIAPWWLRLPVRLLLDACRAINEMVFALLFVVAVGLGPFAGVLALWVHTTGILGKLFSEAVEATDPRPVEGIRATGATPLHEVLYGIVPQVMPLWLSYTLYRFESNVRSAAVVGMVGAGGIGMVLWDVMRGFQYAQTAAVLILVVACVSLLDLLSSQLRKRLL